MTSLLRAGAVFLSLSVIGSGGTGGRSAAPQAARPPAPPLHPFLPGIVSAAGVSQAYVARTPDGRTLYLAGYERFGGEGLVSIEVSRLLNGVWTRPRTAPFSGKFHDHQPCVSPDGRFVYFISKRPTAGDAPREDYEPWRVEIRGEGWGEPEHLAVLGGRANEYAPFVARSGAVYFSSDRPGGLGSGDLYVAEPNGDSFAAPRNLGAPVNGPSGEWGSTLDASETLLIFESSGRAQNLSDSGDLYFSPRVGGSWTDPRHFAAPINSTASDLGPRISLDGRSLLFSTNRNGTVATFEVRLDAAVAAADPPPASR